MSSEALWPHLITAGFTAGLTWLITSCGWRRSEKYSQRRDKENRRTEWRLESLRQIWSDLRYIANQKVNESNEPELTNKIDAILADIQLVGTSKQNQMMNEIVKKLSGGGFTVIDDLLGEIRSSFRKELGLLDAPPGIIYFVYTKDTIQNSVEESKRD